MGAALPRGGGLTRLSFALLLALCAAGCPDDPPVVSDGGADDWESFAMPFFESYCLRCHHSSLPEGEMRSFAPIDLSFDDPELVRANGDRIRRAVGELAFMPPNDPLPTRAERDRLVAWIDAGMPGL